MSQLFHIHPDNPQARLITQAVDIIKQGGVVVYPTDSGYAIGCNIGNKQAKERIERIRGIDKNDNFTLATRKFHVIVCCPLFTNIDQSLEFLRGACIEHQIISKT